MNDKHFEMTPAMREAYTAQALKVLKDNDRGYYTVPTGNLYPFQWNWDSALSALGLRHIDEQRAWIEIATLFEHQWEDGMVPHIIFHENDEGYFPGPDVWQTGRPVPTSGITQPAITGFAVRQLYEKCADRELAKRWVEKLLPAIDSWHQWFYTNRDPNKTGLVAIIHPWESGRDNSVDWDEAFERVPVDGVQPFTRRDTSHANPEHRPTHEQYSRYIWLVQCFRDLGWDNSKLHDASPFQIVDPGFNAILIRSCEDIAFLADEFGMGEIAKRNRDFAAFSREALESLWSEKHGQYLCLDRVTGLLVESLSIGGILTIFAGVEEPRLQRVAQRIRELSGNARYLVPSHDPESSEFDSDRYWRGPAWLIVNYMLFDALKNAGEQDLAYDIFSSSMELIEKGGMAEYHDPLSGQGCGGAHFTWTAAMVLEFLDAYDV